MDSLLNEKMKSLLADPEAMGRMMEMAGRLFSGTESGGSDGEGAHGETRDGKVESSEKDGSALGALLHAVPAGETAPKERARTKEDYSAQIRLIDALCPFLNPTRREIAQAMVRALRLFSMAENAGLLGNRR